MFIAQYLQRKGYLRDLKVETANSAEDGNISIPTCIPYRTAKQSSQASLYIIVYVTNRDMLVNSTTMAAEPVRMIAAENEITRTLRKPNSC